MADPIDADVLNFHQLAELFEKSLEAVEKGDEPLHQPHAVVLFAHEYYHEAVETVLVNHKLEGTKVDAEQLFRTVMERMWMLGYNFRNACYRINPCECGSVTDEKLDAWLGEHKHE